MRVGGIHIVPRIDPRDPITIVFEAGSGEAGLGLDVSNLLPGADSYSAVHIALGSGTLKFGGSSVTPNQTLDDSDMAFLTFAPPTTVGTFELQFAAHNSDGSISPFSIVIVVTPSVNENIVGWLSISTSLRSDASADRFESGLP